MSEVDCPVGDSKGRRCMEADRAAETAVEKTFAILGVNIHEPKEVQAFQDSLRFNRAMKNIVDKAIMVLMTAGLVGIWTWVWEIIKGWGKSK